MKHAVYDVCKIQLTNEETKKADIMKVVLNHYLLKDFLKYSGQSVEKSTLLMI